MKTLFNFSHQLSTEAKAELEAQVGPIEEKIIPVHLDLDRPLRPQIDDLLAEHEIQSLNEADYIIPPALGPAAYILAREHIIASKRKPPVVWLKRTDTLPPKFVIGGIESFPSSTKDPPWAFLPPPHQGAPRPLCHRHGAHYVEALIYKDDPEQLLRCSRCQEVAPDNLQKRKANER